MPRAEGRARPALRAPPALASLAPRGFPRSKPRRPRGAGRPGPAAVPSSRGLPEWWAATWPLHAAGGLGAQAGGPGAATARGPRRRQRPAGVPGPQGARARAATCSSPDDIWKESANGQSGVYFETANNDFSRVKRQPLRARSGGF